MFSKKAFEGLPLYSFLIVNLLRNIYLLETTETLQMT